MKTVYLDSSVISYLTARPSRDLVVAAYQQLTREWWNNELQFYNCFISDIVIDEISRGDTTAAADRLTIVKDFSKIAFNEKVLEIAKQYNKDLGLPDKAQLDLFHLALAVGNGMDFILSWNFKHIANAFVREKLYTINKVLGLRTPMICTPEELIGGLYE